MGSLPINTDGMLKFYKELDIIELKYGAVWRNARFDELEAYEAENQLFTLTKKSYEDAAENLNLVYGERAKTEVSIQLIDLILNKIIGQYINIDGMERLFSMNYIDFEWEMHLSADYKMHNMKFYRDHFIHQIRDAYMMHMLLEKGGFEDYVKNVLEDESISKVSRYVGKCLKQQMRIYQDSLRTDVLRGEPNGGENARPDFKGKDFYMHNLIYMSSYMAALFHDIGYPESHHLSSSERIIEYIAGMYNISDTAASLHKIFALLQNSLLFRLVPFKEISNRILVKRDHGAISSIVFLMNFYENGSIFRLPPYKSAAVELAGLAIYNHTNIYSLLKPGAKDCDAVRPCFVANPISYLLRLSDDLQEWDRTYFLISNGSNILFCNKCRTPLLGVRKEGDGGTVVSEYKCNCKEAIKRCNDVDDGNSCFSQAFDGDAKFSYRRIYNVTVCDGIQIEEPWKDKSRMLISLHYDTYKLLHAAFTHPTYAKYRIEELNQLKHMLELQDGMPSIYLEYFVTSNPVHIKVKMLEDYLTDFTERIGGMVREGTKENGIEVTGDLKKELEKIKGEIKTELKQFIDGACLHDNFCKECSLCENVIHAFPEIYYCGNKKPSGFSACQHEWNVKCLCWRTTKENYDVSELAKGNPDKNQPCEKLCLDRNLLIPDLKKTFEEHGKEIAEVFYDDPGKKLCFNEIEKKMRNECPVNQLRQYLESALGFYIDLYICQSISRYLNTYMPVTKALWKNIISEYAEKYAEKFGNSEKFEALQCLTEDCFMQFQRMYADIVELDYYPKNYYRQYENGQRKTAVFGAGSETEAEGYYYSAALNYISPEKYEPYLKRYRKERSDALNYIDAYTDLYFFHLLAKELSKQS